MVKKYNICVTCNANVNKNISHVQKLLKILDLLNLSGKQN